MKKPPFTKSEVEEILILTKDAIGRTVFELPTHPNKQMSLEKLLPAPYSEKGYAHFKRDDLYLNGKDYVFQTYTTNEYRIVGIAYEVTRHLMPVLNPPHFVVEMEDLQARGILVFDSPENTPDN